jgi:hypothetical protein
LRDGMLLRKPDRALRVGAQQATSNASTSLRATINLIPTQRATFCWALPGPGWIGPRSQRLQFNDAHNLLRAAYALWQGHKQRIRQPRPPPITARHRRGWPVNTFGPLTNTHFDAQVHGIPAAARRAAAASWYSQMR